MKSKERIQKEWFEKGQNYAQAINERISHINKYGWENVEQKEILDSRENLSVEVLKLLKEANKNDSVRDFRKDFPPAHAPLISILDEKGIYIGDIVVIDHNKVACIQGAPYEVRQAYLIEKGIATKLSKNIKSIGKSLRNNVFATAYSDKIITRTGWAGETIREFSLNALVGAPISKLLPFNNGKKILVVTSEGIYLLTEKKEILLTEWDKDENDDYLQISMENATLSNDNSYIVIGDQDSEHSVFDSDGKKIGTIGPQSSYPHYCLFSNDDSQLLTNSCHFYNGTSIGISTSLLDGICIPAWEESSDTITLEDDMRVYAAVSVEDYYILGDAYGYIKAITKDGEKLWQHFLGSTISGMAVSDEQQVLFVGTYAGILHKLYLDQKCEDTHSISDASIFEDYRLLMWKNEDSVWRW